jgi:glycerol-3-phosphate dehydrogenase (NAD(P)+)
MSEATLVVLAVPSASLEENLEAYSNRIPSTATVLSAIKGIDPATARRMSEIIISGGVTESRVLALSGPNFATEIALGLPAATVVAGSDAGRARQVQAALTGPSFRVYTSDDRAGVEFGGALKNVIAIACGVSDGLGLGQNAKAALMTRGLAEMTRLGTACGATPLTFLGLSGIGDLIATCESDLSRNRRFGLALAAGKSVATALADSDGVVEGVITAKAIRLLQERSGVEMPISSELQAVLYEGKDPKASMLDLMSRAPRSES